MFISFEGIDGCGKSTQVRLLEDSMKAQGKSVLVLREPGATPLSEAVRNVLLHSNVDIDPLAELLLFCASRRQLVESVIRPALAAGHVVICDRYLDSSTAYQGYGRGLKLSDVEQANRLATDSLLPDITFFLDISVELSFERAARRSATAPDRMERSGKEFFDRVRSGYLHLCESSEGRVRRLDGGNSIDALHTEIRQLLSDLTA